MLLSPIVSRIPERHSIKNPMLRSYGQTPWAMTAMTTVTMAAAVAACVMWLQCNLSVPVMSSASAFVMQYDDDYRNEGCRGV